MRRIEEPWRTILIAGAIGGTLVGFGHIQKELFKKGISLELNAIRTEIGELHTPVVESRSDLDDLLTRAGVIETAMGPDFSGTPTPFGTPTIIFEDDG